MKLDLSASWGYPVMRPTIDDYIESEFQSSVAMRASSDLKTVELSYEILLSVAELRALVDSGKARALIYVYCHSHQVAS